MMKIQFIGWVSKCRGYSNICHTHKMYICSGVNNIHNIQTSDNHYPGGVGGSEEEFHRASKFFLIWPKVLFGVIHPHRD